MPATAFNRITAFRSNPSLARLLASSAAETALTAPRRALVPALPPVAMAPYVPPGPPPSRSMARPSAPGMMHGFPESLAERAGLWRPAGQVAEGDAGTLPEGTLDKLEPGATTAQPGMMQRTSTWIGSLPTSVKVGAGVLLVAGIVGGVMLARRGSGGGGGRRGRRRRVRDNPRRGRRRSARHRDNAIGSALAMD